VAAVRAFDPHHPVLTTIRALKPDGAPVVSTEPYPYIRLLHEDQLPIVRSIDVICSNPIDPLWQDICHKTTPLTFDATKFENKTIVVGITGLGTDLHETVIGTVPGVILQANYIESLLANHLFAPIPRWSEIVLGLLGLLLPVGIGWYWRTRPLWALLWSVVAVLGFALITLRILIWCGYYTEFLLPVVSVALIVNVTLILHHLLVRFGEAHG
jgi:hypothetical protein